MDIRDICFFDILAKKKTMNAARYLKFLKRLMDHWHGNRKHAARPADDNAKPHHSASVTF